MKKQTTLKQDFAPNIHYRAERWYERAWREIVNFSGLVFWLAAACLFLVIFFEVVK